MVDLLLVDIPLPRRNIELEMIVNGWAWVLDRYGPGERYALALEDAQHHRRGIWANDDNIPPWEFKRQKHRRQRQQPPSALAASPPLPGVLVGDLVENISK